MKKIGEASRKIIKIQHVITNKKELEYYKRSLTDL